jgi:hypothetical protein
MSEHSRESDRRLEVHRTILRHRLSVSEADRLSEELSRTPGIPGPTVPSNLDGSGTKSTRIPSTEQLASIAAALRNLLDTFEQYKLFLDDPSGPIDDGVPTNATLATDVLCSTEMQDAFCGLERLLNPRRLPYGSPELARISVRGWPRQVMAGLSVLQRHVDQLIQRWDIPEVCDDRPMARGRFGITRDDGTIEEIDRPIRRCTLTTAERAQLRWVLNTFIEAIQEAIGAPRPNPISEGENRPAVALASGTMPPPRSGATTDRARNDESQDMIKDQVFISYSRQDKRFLDELQKHLKPYLRKGSIRVWSDEQIKPGSKWFDEIKAALARTSVAVMLVSPDFLASDFIHEHELGPLLKEAEAGGVKIRWVLIRDCAWKETPLKDDQAVVCPLDKPLALMTRGRRDTAWRKVCEEIKTATSQPSDGSPDSAGAASVSRREAVSIDSKPQTQFGATARHDPAIDESEKSSNVVRPSRVIYPLHGIRTKDGPRIPRPQTAAPWCLYAALLALTLLAATIAAYVASHHGTEPLADGPASATSASAQPAPGTVLEGYVTDAETRARLADVTLTIQDRDTRDGGSPPPAVTDASGRFRFKDLRPSADPTQQVRLIATKPGYETSWSDPPLGTTDHTIKLKRLNPSECRP